MNVHVFLLLVFWGLLMVISILPHHMHFLNPILKHAQLYAVIPHWANAYHEFHVLLDLGYRVLVLIYEFLCSYS